MATKLDRLLDSIAPEQTLDAVTALADAALTSFHPDQAVVTDWEAFKACLGRFFCHLENHLLRLEPPRAVDHWMDWGRCCRLLMEEYGKNGEKAAFEMVRTGNEGGLYAVLKAVAQRTADQCASNGIAARVSAYWSALPVDEQFEVMDEYLEKYGHLFPSELTEGSRPPPQGGIP